MGVNASSLISGDRAKSANSAGRLAATENGAPHLVYGAQVSMAQASDHLTSLHKDRKRKITSLATLRKKLLIRRRRTSKSLDHARIMREFIADWLPRELTALVQEYEASSALKELVIQADLARPPATTFKQDLLDLFNFKYCTDVDLLFQGMCFPVHRALLSVRCPYFRDLLAKCPGYGVQVPVDIQTQGMDVSTFSALLRFLYTGDLSSCRSRLNNLDVLIALGNEFGTPKSLDHDLRHLLDTGEYADAVLVFASGGSGVGVGDNPTYQGEYGFSTAPKLELACHKAILSARSPFFRNLLQRRARSGDEVTERAFRTPTRIVLDELVISKRYARVLLQSIYLDSVELSGILRCSPSTSSLSEVQAMVAGRSHPSLTEEAMEIYQIGRFLELDVLSQGCEDLIAESLTVENIVPVLRWSEQPHGSAWVYRQALHFLREEFQSIAASPVLNELERSHLEHALQSDFLQASELEVLQAVLKWGEHQLIRRVEEREPNLLSHTAHSVSKKGVKKRDLNDSELREVLTDMLPLVRIPHILPTDHELLVQATRRHLVSTPPPHMLNDDVDFELVSHTRRIRSWLRGTNNSFFIKPRLFTPYVEEVKAILDEHVVQEAELVHLHTVRMSHIPDTLYMVEETSPSLYSTYASYNTASVDVVAGAIPVPDAETLQAMLKRETELRQTTVVQQAYAMPLANRRDLNHQLQLRIVREFNLPDSVADVLQGAAYYYPEDVREEPEVPLICGYPCSEHSSYPCANSYISSYSSYHTLENDSSTCNDGHLSDIMPDIALATASFSQLSFQTGEMELDLGDRNKCIGSMYI